MNGSELDLLQWARGPGLAIASAVLVFGIVLRLFEIFALGRKPDLSEPRAQRVGSGWQTIVTRSIPRGVEWYDHLPGYVFHVGLCVVVLLLVPHIEVVRRIFGIGWPGLPTPVVDFIAVVTLIALFASLLQRLMKPARRFLSTPVDWFVWGVTLLPVLTGYMAYHHMLLAYPNMLAVHILSVELLFVVFPFTKLTHAFTLFISRWYNGEVHARKGVAS